MKKKEDKTAFIYYYYLSQKIHEQAQQHVMDLKIVYITIFCGDWVRRLLQEHFFLELKIIILLLMKIL